MHVACCIYDVLSYNVVTYILVGGGVKIMNISTNDIIGVNYTGPYISNGAFQESVQFGEKPPTNALDALSRLHDSAYNKWDDRLHRTVADEIYYKSASKLPGYDPAIAANAVLYGNHTARSFSNLASGYAKGPLGLVYGGLENMYDLYQYTANGDIVRKEIQDFYATDPHPELQRDPNEKYRKPLDRLEDYGGVKMSYNNIGIIPGETFVEPKPNPDRYLDKLGAATYNPNRVSPEPTVVYNPKLEPVKELTLANEIIDYGRSHYVPLKKQGISEFFKSRNGHFSPGKPLLGRKKRKKNRVHLMPTC